MKIIGKRNQEIAAWENWERPIGGNDKWAEGRSAMEIAKAFFRQSEPQLPDRLRALLMSQPAFAGFAATHAHPEFNTALPPIGASGPRNHDVWVRGRVGELSARVGIEAKADESFDDTLTAKQTHVAKQVASGNSTDMGDRLAILGALLFGGDFDLAKPVYAERGYQLLSGAVGTIIQAAHDDASLAAFVVYEFVSSKTNPRKQARNAADLDTFVRLLPGASQGIVPGQLVGPFRFAASEFVPRSVDLFIGKIVERV